MKTRVPSLLPLLALALLLALACGGRLLPGAAAADAAAGLEEEAGEVMEALKEAVQVGWVCCSVPRGVVCWAWDENGRACCRCWLIEPIV